MSNEAKNWHHTFTKSELCEDIPLILHFVKVPLEASAETIESATNQHGRKSRYSLRPSSLSNEVQKAWNGHSEFSIATAEIINIAIDKYLGNIQTGLRFK